MLRGFLGYTRAGEDINLVNRQKTVNIDLSTLLGVVGVALTILFFVVGYRQTIGARKERARAANKAATDAIFRRLTLEEKFETDPPAVNRLLLDGL